MKRAVSESKKSYSKYLKYCLIAFLAFSSLATSFVYASSFKEPGILESKYEVLKGLNSYVPAVGEYPFDQDYVYSVSFNKLYGEYKGLVRYLGEVPYDISTVDSNNRLRTYNSYTIDGKRRPWSYSDGAGGHGFSGALDSQNEEHLKDLHVKAMVYTSDDAKWFDAFHIAYLFKDLFKLPLEFLFLVKSLNLSSLIDLVDEDGQFAEVINSAFLIDGEGNISPFLLFMLVLYVFGLAFYTVKGLTGDKSFAVLRRELLVFLLALCVAGVSLTETAQSTISKWGVNTLTNLMNDLVIGGNDSSSLFITKTSDPAKDGTYSQKALISKLDIDSVIRVQFGVPVEELDVNAKNFGSRYQDAVYDTFGDGRDFSVSNGAVKVNNLGYYFWAANSEVDEKDPIDGNSVKTASNYRVLYVIDFLNNARKYAEAAGETEIVNKIDSIAARFWNPNYGDGASSVFLIGVLNLVLFFALLATTIFLSLGKVVVTVGTYAVAVLPGLILFEKTRDFAKKLAATYLVGFARLLIGLLLFDLIIAITASVSSKGVTGVLVAIVIAFVAAFVSPKVILEVNRVLQREEFPFMRPVNRFMNAQLAKGSFAALKYFGRSGQVSSGSYAQPQASSANATPATSAPGAFRSLDTSSPSVASSYQSGGTSGGVGGSGSSGLSGSSVSAKGSNGSTWSSEGSEGQGSSGESSGGAAATAVVSADSAVVNSTESVSAPGSSKSSDTTHVSNDSSDLSDSSNKSDSSSEDSKSESDVDSNAKDESASKNESSTEVQYGVSYKSENSHDASESVDSVKSEVYEEPDSESKGKYDSVAESDVKFKQESFERQSDDSIYVVEDSNDESVSDANYLPQYDSDSKDQYDSVAESDVGFTQESVEIQSENSIYVIEDSNVVATPGVNYVDEESNKDKPSDASYDSVSTDKSKSEDVDVIESDQKDEEYVAEPKDFESDRSNESSGVSGSEYLDKLKDLVDGKETGSENPENDADVSDSESEEPTAESYAIESKPATDSVNESSTEAVHSKDVKYSDSSELNEETSSYVEVEDSKNSKESDSVKTTEEAESEDGSYQDSESEVVGSEESEEGSEVTHEYEEEQNDEGEYEQEGSEVTYEYEEEQNDGGEYEQESDASEEDPKDEEDYEENERPLAYKDEES